MSREIDLTKPLSEEDKNYLLIRGREYDVQQAELRSAPEKVVHTGDVGTQDESKTSESAGIRQQGTPVSENAASRAAAAGMPGIVTEDDEDDDAEDVASEPLEAPYDQHTKKALIAEINRRNALPENAEYEDISTSGDKATLVAALEEDDEASA